MRKTTLHLLLAVVLLLAAQVAFAASDITVTVTLQQVGVSVSPTSWALGTMAPGAAQSSWVSGNAGHFTATNAGNVAEDLTIAAGATSPSNWAAGSSSAVDVYVIGFGIGSGDYTSEPTYATFTTTTSLATSVAAAGTVDFDLEFTAPATGSTFDAGGQTFTVSLAASAS